MYLQRAVAILPGRYRDLSESSEQHSRGEADKGHDGPLQEVQFSHQYIGGFCTLWDLLHEVHVHLVRQGTVDVNIRIQNNLLSTYITSSLLTGILLHPVSSELTMQTEMSSI